MIITSIIIIFIIIIIMFFEIKKISKNNNYENATNTTTDAQLTAINNQISSIYNMDVEAIRNLGAISKSLLTGTNYHSTTVGTPGQLTIPADRTILNGNLTVNGNTNVIGILDVNGKRLIPPGIIMAWYQATPPAGWGYCNGATYGNIKSPDLRSRFIVGAGQGGGLSDRPTNSVGGEENHTLSIHEIPSHSHSFDDQYYSENLGARGWEWGSGATDADNQSADLVKNKNTGNTGSGWGHNNMPPYYALIYIIYIG